MRKYEMMRKQENSVVFFLIRWNFGLGYSTDGIVFHSTSLAGDDDSRAHTFSLGTHSTTLGSRSRSRSRSQELLLLVTRPASQLSKDLRQPSRQSSESCGTNERANERSPPPLQPLLSHLHTHTHTRHHHSRRKSTKKNPHTSTS